MSLRYALLASLSAGPASGYELAKRFDISVANFWHASPQQLYVEVGRMEADGLVAGRQVVQERRPNKRVLRLTAAGRRCLSDWLGLTSRPTVIKDELLVRVSAVTDDDAAALLGTLDDWRKHHEAKLAVYESLAPLLLDGRDEAELYASDPRVGVYLTLKRGLSFERENLAWLDEVASVLRSRAER